MILNRWLRCRPVGLMVALFTVGFFSACDDDDNTTDPDDDHHEEEAEGLIVTDETGAEILRVWEGVVTGEIEVAHGESTGRLTIQFLDADSSMFVPELDEGFEMGLAVEDEMVATADSLDHFVFQVTGVEEGMTDLTISILHEGHSDFDSPAIEIHVEEEFEAEGLVISDGATELVHVWEGVVTGSIGVAAGASTGTLTVEFLAPDSSKFVPEASEGFEMRLLGFVPTTATADSLGHFMLRVNGVSAGTTNLNVGVFHIDHLDFTSPDLPIMVSP